MTVDPERRQLEEVLDHLKRARSIMGALMVWSDDWSEKARVRAEFDGLEEAVTDFARHQLGIKRVG